MITQHSLFEIELFKEVVLHCKLAPLVLLCCTSELVGQPTVSTQTHFCGIFAFARLNRWIVEWRSTITSCVPISLTSTMNFEGALHLNELSYRSEIGLILKSQKQPFEVGPTCGPWLYWVRSSSPSKLMLIFRGRNFFSEMVTEKSNSLRGL